MTDRLILTCLLNIHYVNNKTIGPRPAGLWTANVDFVVFGFPGFRYLADVAFEWISLTSALLNTENNRNVFGCFCQFSASLVYSNPPV